MEVYKNTKPCDQPRTQPVCSLESTPFYWSKRLCDDEAASHLKNEGAAYKCEYFNCTLDHYNDAIWWSSKSCTDSSVGCYQEDINKTGELDCTPKKGEKPNTKPQFIGKELSGEGVVTFGKNLWHKN